MRTTMKKKSEGHVGRMQAPRCRLGSLGASGRHAIPTLPIQVFFLFKNWFNFNFSRKYYIVIIYKIFLYIYIYIYIYIYYN
jgi:hypothetical protein